MAYKTPLYLRRVLHRYLHAGATGLSIYFIQSHSEKHSYTGHVGHVAYVTGLVHVCFFRTQPRAHRRCALRGLRPAVVWCLSRPLHRELTSLSQSLWYAASCFPQPDSYLPPCLSRLLPAGRPLLWPETSSAAKQNGVSIKQRQYCKFPYLLNAERHDNINTTVTTRSAHHVGIWLENYFPFLLRSNSYEDSSASGKIFKHLFSKWTTRKFCGQ
jgi:hypothetical protein